MGQASVTSAVTSAATSAATSFFTLAYSAAKNELTSNGKHFLVTVSRPNLRFPSYFLFSGTVHFVLARPRKEDVPVVEQEADLTPSLAKEGAPATPATGQLEPALPVPLLGQEPPLEALPLAPGFPASPSQSRAETHTPENFLNNQAGPEFVGKFTNTAHCFKGTHNDVTN